MNYETDSRKVKKGQVFVAIKGHTVDGHDYINDAINNGASMIVAQKSVDCSVPLKIVSNSEEYLKEVLKEEYAKEINELKLVGITGTSGKTTTAYLTYQLFNALGKKCAYIGTNGFKMPDYELETDNTTPDILNLYSLLLQAKKNLCEVVVMEVSSHALSYERIYGLNLDVAVFTNLTEDHLDYHKNMEDYLNTKLNIVNYLKQNGKLIVNGDDTASQAFVNKLGHAIKLGFNNKEYDYNIVDADITPAETLITLDVNSKVYNIKTGLTSKFNVYNYVSALAILNNMGYGIEEIISKTSELKAPKGRCETYKVKDAFAVVDYAHKPDALEKVITAYNEFKKARVITIIGCGGDRDPIKRPIMGGIATRLSDYTILTSDNPRTEDPQKIMEDILKGVVGNNYEVILDRKEAIKKGLDMLEKNDILLVLGKGHEDYQIIGHTKIHLDDAEEIENWKKIHGE